jgi:hypothetical protein
MSKSTRIPPSERPECTVPFRPYGEGTEVTQWLPATETLTYPKPKSPDILQGELKMSPSATARQAASDRYLAILALISRRTAQ